MPFKLSYAERAAYAQNTLAQQLFTLMSDKETNLALSADVVHCDALLTLADQLGSDICVLKTHVDILEDFSPSFVKALQALALKHQFFIFEDRKFADIGHTVKLQYEKGIYHIADWAHIVNAHTLPGPGIVSGLAEAGLSKQRGLLLLAEMSSSHHLFNQEYIQKTLAIAEQFPHFVMGFISQKKLLPHPGWMYMTPGVQWGGGSDTLGQGYVTPQKAITDNQSDIIIVGRGIIRASDPSLEAKKYRKAGWEAYIARL